MIVVTISPSIEAASRIFRYVPSPRRSTVYVPGESGIGLVVVGSVVGGSEISSGFMASSEATSGAFVVVSITVTEASGVYSSSSRLIQPVYSP